MMDIQTECPEHSWKDMMDNSSFKYKGLGVWKSGFWSCNWVNTSWVTTFCHVGWAWLPISKGLNQKMYVNVLSLMLAHDKQSVHDSCFIILLQKAQGIDTSITCILYNMCVSRWFPIGSRDSTKRNTERNERDCYSDTWKLITCNCNERHLYLT